MSLDRREKLPFTKSFTYLSAFLNKRTIQYVRSKSALREYNNAK